MTGEPFYITTPIYYVNANPHIGHAYTTIMTDIVARHHRQLGDDVFFLTGTDEHGAKIAQAAERAGRSPKAHTDALSQRFRALGEVLNSTYDFFIRTTDPQHEDAVAQIVARMHDHGDVYRGSYGGWYCTACEVFYNEDDLADGHRCPIHTTAVEWQEEENWFFRLSAYRDRLLAHYDAHPDWVLPTARRNEARRMVEAGLDDLSVSRGQIAWGIPVPWDREQTIYVWIDALLNYRTALGYARPGDDLVARYWPPKLQVMAKDILKFHAVIWPAMLMSAGMELPEQLMVHGYLLKGGEKMSKTLGNVVDPFPFIERYGIDALRYYLAREVRFGEDGTFTAEGFEQRYANELANELGNLLNRTVNMIGRYRDGVVPADPGHDAALAAEVAATVEAVKDAYAALDISRAMDDAWALVRRANRLAEERAPWTLAKDPSKASDLDQALFSLAETLRIAALLVWPTIPASAEQLLGALGQDPSAVGFTIAEWGAGTAASSTAPIPPLFPRIDDPEAAK